MPSDHHTVYITQIIDVTSRFKRDLAQISPCEFETLT